MFNVTCISHVQHPRHALAAPKHACTSAGRPNIGIDIGSIKPWQTVLVGALGLVAAGKPVTGDKRFPGDFSITLPGIKTGLAQVSSPAIIDNKHIKLT